MQWAQLRQQVEHSDGELLHDCTVFTHASAAEPGLRFELLVWRPTPKAPAESAPPELQDILANGFLHWALRCSRPCVSGADWHPLAFAHDGAPLAELGGVVADNALVRSLFDWLTLPADEWWGRAGSVSPDYWRGSILRMLSELRE